MNAVSTSRTKSEKIADSKECRGSVDLLLAAARKYVRSTERLQMAVGDGLAAMIRACSEKHQVEKTEQSVPPNGESGVLAPMELKTSKIGTELACLV